MSEKGKSMWLRFFREAGILSGFDTKYALVFDENRIKMDMLMDINKECLKDMGITAMGDIIAILKHAKHVYEESKAQAYEVPRPTSTSTPSNTVSSTATTNRISQSPSSGSSSSTSSSTSGPKSVIINSKLQPIPNVSKSATGRVVEKKIIKTLQVNTPPVPISSKLGSINKSIGRQDCDSIMDGNRIESSKSSTVVRLKRNISPDQRLEVPLQKKIRVLPEQEGQYKIIMPQGKTAKTQKLLQDRLGPTVPSTTTGREKKTSVFARLGGEGRVSSSSEANSPPQRKESIDEVSLKSKPSVFARLGKGSPTNSPTSSKVSTSNSDFGLNTRFVVQQGISKNTSPFKKSSESMIFREKTLTTIPSSISKYLDRNRISSPDRPRSNSNSSNFSNSKTRLSMDGGNSESVKARLGIRGSHNLSRSRSITRSPSPAIRRRLINTVSSRDRIDGNFRNSAGTSKVSTVPRVINSKAAVAVKRSSIISRVSRPTEIAKKMISSSNSKPVASKNGTLIRQEKFINKEGKLMKRSIYQAPKRI